jgi:hypothetical protein
MAQHDAARALTGRVALVTGAGRRNHDAATGPIDIPVHNAGGDIASRTPEGRSREVSFKTSELRSSRSIGDHRRGTRKSPMIQPRGTARCRNRN